MLLFGLPAVAGFAELPLQNHLPGDAGHLAVGHCVGSVPGARGKGKEAQSQSTCTHRLPPSAHLLLKVGSILQAGLVLFGEEK